MAEIITEYAHFFTATNLEWKKLLLPDSRKDVIIESMRFIVEDKRVIIVGFVIMPNHIHVIWQMQAGRKRDAVQRFVRLLLLKFLKASYTVFIPVALDGEIFCSID